MMVFSSFFLFTCIRLNKKWSIRAPLVVVIGVKINGFVNKSNIVCIDIIINIELAFLYLNNNYAKNC